MCQNYTKLCQNIGTNVSEKIPYVSGRMGHVSGPKSACVGVSRLTCQGVRVNVSQNVCHTICLPSG